MFGWLRGSGEVRSAGWLSGSGDGGRMGAVAGGEDWGASGGGTGLGVEVGSSSRHERRRARLSSNSLAASDCAGAGIVGGELLREGEGDRILCGGVC